MVHTKIYFLLSWPKKGIILIHSHQTVIVVLAVVNFFFFFGQSKGKRGQCPWLNSQALHVLKILVAHWLKIAVIDQCYLNKK